MLKTFLRDGAIYTIPSFLSRGLSLILVPLYTRVLNPSDYGSLDLLMVFSSIVGLTIALEVSQGVARFFQQEPDKVKQTEYASTALWFTIFCYTTFSIIMLTFSSAMAKIVMGQENMQLPFQLGIVQIWFTSILYLMQNQFRWELRSKDFAIISMISTIVSAVLSVLLVYVIHLGLNGLILGTTIGTAFAVIVGFFKLSNSFKFKFSSARLKEMLHYSAPLVPSGIAVFVSTYINRIMINHYLEIEDVGLFGIGFRLASIVSLVMISFSSALTPLIYSNYQKEDTPYQINRIFKVFVVASLLVFSFLTLFAHEILVIMTTPEYYSASSIVGMLVLGVLFSQMYIFAPGIAISKKTHWFIWINISGAVINTLLNLVLIPFMGIQGAALATFLGYVFVFTFYIRVSQKLYFIPYDWNRVAPAFGIALMFVLLVQYLVPNTNIAVLFKIIALIIIVLVIFSTKLLQLEEIKPVIITFLRRLRIKNNQ